MMISQSLMLAKQFTHSEMKVHLLNQGDEERKNGQEPIAMMDREKVNELPQMQVTFMKYICVPCYELIVATIPECQQLLDRCL